MVYHVSPLTNGTLKYITFFCVGAKVFCLVQPPERMGVSGLSIRPWFSQGLCFDDDSAHPCVSGVKKDYQSCPWVRLVPCWGSRKAGWVILNSPCNHPSRRKPLKQPNHFLYLPGVHCNPTGPGSAVPRVSDHPIHSTRGMAYLFYWYILGMSLHLSDHLFLL